MAQRRMVSKQIVDSDDFLEMPLSAQALYLHLLVRADDDGFTNGIKKVMRMIGSREDDLKVLIGKRFVLLFDSGVLVIKHWLIHNSIRKDRYKETVHTEEKALLSVKDNQSYTMATNWQPTGNQLAPQVRLGEVRLGEVRGEKDLPVDDEQPAHQKSTKTRYLEYVLLKDDEHDKLVDLMGDNVLQKYIENLNNYIGSKGKRYKSHYHTLRNWYRRDHDQSADKPKRNFDDL